MTEAHALYLPAPYQDALDSGRLILKDGSVAALRVVTSADTGKLRLFFERLSKESRQKRFFSEGMPGHSLDDVPFEEIGGEKRAIT